MNKREYCESRESVAYYSGLNGLEIKGIEYGIDDFFIAFRVVGMAGKPRGVSTVAKSTTPQTGKIAHFLGLTGTKSRLMNVLEWGFNYEILAIRELGTRAD